MGIIVTSSDVSTFDASFTPGQVDEIKLTHDGEVIATIEGAGMVESFDQLNREVLTKLTEVLPSEAKAAVAVLCPFLVPV